MVVISIKSNDGNGDGFLFETTTDATNDDLISSLVEIQNLRLRSRVIVDSVRGLAEYSHGGSSQSRNGDGSGSSSGSGSGSGSDEVRSVERTSCIRFDFIRSAIDVFFCLKFSNGLFTDSNFLLVSH